MQIAESIAQPMTAPVILPLIDAMASSAPFAMECHIVMAMFIISDVQNK